MLFSKLQSAGRVGNSLPTFAHQGFRVSSGDRAGTFDTSNHVFDVDYGAVVKPAAVPVPRWGLRTRAIGEHWAAFDGDPMSALTALCECFAPVWSPGLCPVPGSRFGQRLASTN